MLDYTDPQGIASGHTLSYGHKATLRVCCSLDEGRVNIPPGEASSSGLFITEKDFDLVVLKLREWVSPKDVLEDLILKYGLRKKIG